MFRITIAFICLFTGTLSDAFGNGTKLKGLNCTEWLPSKLNDLWLCGAEFNTTKVWLCTSHNSSNISDQTSLIHVECAKRLQSPSNCKEKKHEAATAQTTPQTKGENDFWMPFIYGAAAGAGFMIFMDMILYIHYCRLKKRRTRKTLKDRAVVDTEYGITDTFLSVDQETVQPLCEDDVDAIVEPDESEQDLYLAPVDLHAETGRVIKNETPADKNTRQDPIYGNVDEQTGFPPVNSTAIEDGGDIEGRESGAAEVTTTSKKDDQVRLKFGKQRYQDLKRPTGQEHPTYENCEEDSKLYMTPLVENNQSDGRLAERPSSVAYVNAP